MLLDNPFTNDRRVHREAKELVQNGYAVTVFCVKKENLPTNEIVDGIEIKRVFPDLVAQYAAEKINRQIAIEHCENFDVIHAHDQYMCDAGAAVKKKFPLKTFVYDSHELFHAWPLNNLKGLPINIQLKSFLIRKYQITREKKNAKLADYFITVNQSLADILQKYFCTKEKPLIIRNAPEFENIAVSIDLKKQFNIPREEKLLVFIGAHIYARTHNQEQVIDEIGNQYGLHLLYITNNSKGCHDIKAYVKHKNYQNIHFHDAVKPNEITSYLSGCDVGLVPTWNKKNLSYWYALDNKLFEYTIAEIPILATQQPEYINIIEHYQTGVCVNPDEKDSYFRGLQKILSNYSFYKKNCVIAKKELNWGAEKNKLIDFYKKIESKIRQ